MGYTHYNDGKITEETNELYTQLLNTIKAEGGHSLLTIRKDSIGNSADGRMPNIHGSNMENYFHELAWDDNGMPRLSGNFTKTARKRYDIAVVLAYIYNSVVTNTQSNGDYRNSTDDIVQAIQEQNVELLGMGLHEYITKEDIDIGVEQVTAIVKTFFDVAVFEGTLEPLEPYDKDMELEIIAKAIEGGGTSGITMRTSWSLDMERLD